MIEKRKNFIINTIYYALIIVLVYCAYKFLLPILFPFVVGFLIAFVSLRICRKVFKNEAKWMRILVTVFIFVFLFGLIIILGILGINKIIALVAAIPGDYVKYIEPALNDLQKTLITLNNDLPIEIQTDVSELIYGFSDSIKSFVSTISSSFVSIATSLISNTTQIILDITIIIVTAFFFVLDYEKIFKYLVSLMTPKIQEIYFDVKYFIQNTVWLIVRSYGLIMLITCVELCIGLWIIGIDDFGVISVFISFLDILPILGVGTVLIPWGLFLLVAGKIGKGIAILILYVIITLIRNVIEPKIVGGNLGLHALVTLSSMLVGLNTFGALGMFGFPLTISFIVKYKDKHKNLEEGVK